MSSNIQKHTHAVLIISKETNLPIHQIPCKSEKAAERVRDGAEINLNTDLFFAEIRFAEIRKI